MDHEQLKGLLLSVLQTCDEVFARQALLALGHGHCSAHPHPHAERPFDAGQRAEQVGKDLAQERQRADTAEADCEWHKIRLKELDAEAKWQKQRAAEAAEEVGHWRGRIERLRQLL